MSGNAPHPEQGTDQVPPQREVAKEPANLSQQTWQSMQPLQPMQNLNLNDRPGTPGIMQGEMMKHGADSDKPLPLAFKPQGESGGPMPLAFKPNSETGGGRPMYMADGRMVAPGLMLVGESGHDKMVGTRGFGMARQENGAPEKAEQPKVGQPKADQPKAEQERGDAAIRGPVKPELSEKEKAQNELKTKVLDQNAPAEKRLEAVRDLVKQGITSIPIADDKGNKANLRLEVVKAGSNEMVHAFVNSGKHEKTALRGTATENGEFVNQNGKHGKVSMEGRGIRQLNQMHMADSPAPEKSDKMLVRQPVQEPRRETTQTPAPVQEARPRQQVQESAPARTQEQAAPKEQHHAAPKEQPQAAPKEQPLATPKEQAQVTPREQPQATAKEQPRRDRQPEAQEEQPPIKKAAKQPDVQEPASKLGGPKEVTRPANRERMEVPTQGDQSTEGKERVVRDISDRSKFYAHQDDGVSCSAYSMAMMHSDHKTGRPVSYGRESQSFKELAGTIGKGYRGNLQSIADKMERTGLEAKAYEYGRFGEKGMKDLNAELDRGHTAIARVINPHTGNNHYIYVAGRDAKGNYIVGDPDRANRQHSAPVTPHALMKMMSGRDGFVAGWNGNPNRTPEIPGTAGYQMYRRQR